LVVPPDCRAALGKKNLMLWTAPPGGGGPELGFNLRHKRAACRAWLVGLDIAKNVFQAHGVNEEGSIVFRKRLTRAKVIEFFCGAFALSDRHRGVRHRSSLGA
ncbi:MAG: hypothetical protein KDA35_03195, partial [Hyphomonadaceae bacterium]|nr:hypothetical protein [Hyphomonadaceae bacterium]